MTKQHFQHWHKNFDEDNILWLGFDRKDRPVNTISREVLAELAVILEEIRVNEKITGLVIYSLKTKGYIAGADVEQFSNLTDIEVARDFLQQGHALFDSLENLSIPTIALIKGFCLGGGLELALACDYRLAIDVPETRLGLPEILLGIHPAWGGTVRLPKLIGSLSALDMILTGRAIRARQAKKMGLVNDVIPERQMQRAVKHFVFNPPPKKARKLWHKIVEIKLFRKWIAAFLRRKVAKKSPPRTLSFTVCRHRSVANLWRKRRKRHEGRSGIHVGYYS